MDSDASPLGPEGQLPGRLALDEARHTSLTRPGCSGCDAWTLARIAGHQKIQMSMVYVHAQYKEGAGWWGQWWENRKNGGKPITSLAKGAEIRWTRIRQKVPDRKALLV